MDYGYHISKLVGRKVNETMLHTLTILTVMRLLSEAQLNCQNGYATYERIPNHKLIGFQEKTVKLSISYFLCYSISFFWVLKTIHTSNLICTMGQYLGARCRRPSGNGWKMHWLVQKYRQPKCYCLWILQFRGERLGDKYFLNVTFRELFQSGKSRSRHSKFGQEKHRWQESRCFFALLGVYSGLEPTVQLVADENFDHFTQICLKSGSDLTYCYYWNMQSRIYSHFIYIS